MRPATFASLAARLMRHAAVPYHEVTVRAEVELVCREQSLPFRRDRFGNLLIELKHGNASRPLALVAHLDHPGFELLPGWKQHAGRGRFLGGVPAEYFRSGTRLRLLPGNSPARLGKPLGTAQQRTHEIVTDQPPRSRPEFAVWELEDFALRDGLIHGRACDDLIGVAAILATLIQTRRSSRPCWLIGAITRAEEIGFGGALALAASRAIPRRALVVSLETSRELPPVKMNHGVIIRTGDRSSVFDSRATRFLSELAAELAEHNRGFASQRALMSGGSCEGTVFSAAGFQTAAVCVALGNYHNCGPKRRISAEFVSLKDAVSMVRLLTTAAQQLGTFERVTGRLHKRLTQLARTSRRRLLATA